MSSEPKDVRAVGLGLHPEPAIAAWLWVAQDTRARTLRELSQITPAMVDWAPADGGSSIGTLLYHTAAIEADWLFVEVLEQEFPPAVVALFPFPIHTEDGRLAQAPPLSLEQHLERLAAVRAMLVEAFGRMDLADFRRARSLERYDVTPEWVLHHLVQHEAEHRGQIGALRAAAEHTLVQGAAVPQAGA